MVVSDIGVARGGQEVGHGLHGPFIGLGFQGGLVRFHEQALAGGALRSVTLPVSPRRCARLRLRLEGSGGMELRSLSWLTEAGSDV